MSMEVQVEVHHHATLPVPLVPPPATPPPVQPPQRSRLPASADAILPPDNSTFLPPQSPQLSQSTPSQVLDMVTDVLMTEVPRHISWIVDQQAFLSSAFYLSSVSSIERERERDTSECCNKSSSTQNVATNPHPGLLRGRG